MLAAVFSEKIEEKIFLDAELSGGAGGINGICSQPEVADDVISGYNEEAFRDYHATIFVSC